jgi:hypothetical protein
MKDYSKESGDRNNHRQQANRLARRSNCEFGISIDHAIAAVTANGACKEQRGA